MLKAELEQRIKELEKENKELKERVSHVDELRKSRWAMEKELKEVKESMLDNTLKEELEEKKTEISKLKFQHQQMKQSLDITNSTIQRISEALSGVLAGVQSLNALGNQASEMITEVHNYKFEKGGNK